MDTFIDFAQNTQNFLSPHSIWSIGKTLFSCVYLHLSSFVSLSSFKLLNVTLWLAVTHAFKGNGPKFAQ